MATINNVPDEIVTFFRLKKDTLKLKRIEDVLNYYLFKGGFKEEYENFLSSFYGKRADNTDEDNKCEPSHPYDKSDTRII
jgi:hypothetical protein